MPELPDVTVYVEALTARIVGTTRRAIVRGPFLLRSVMPPLAARVTPCPRLARL